MHNQTKTFHNLRINLYICKYCINVCTAARYAFGEHRDWMLTNASVIYILFFAISFRLFFLFSILSFVRSLNFTFSCLQLTHIFVVGYINDVMWCDMMCIALGNWNWLKDIYSLIFVQISDCCFDCRIYFFFHVGHFLIFIFFFSLIFLLPFLFLEREKWYIFVANPNEPQTICTLYTPNTSAIEQIQRVKLIINSIVAELKKSLVLPLQTETKSKAKTKTAFLNDPSNVHFYYAKQHNNQVLETKTINWYDIFIWLPTEKRKKERKLKSKSTLKRNKSNVEVADCWESFVTSFKKLTHQSHRTKMNSWKLLLFQILFIGLMTSGKRLYWTFYFFSFCFGFYMQFIIVLRIKRVRTRDKK